MKQALEQYISGICNKHKNIQRMNSFLIMLKKQALHNMSLSVKGQ